MDNSLKDLLDDFSPEVQQLALSLRERIHEIAPEAEETVMKGYDCLNYGFGSGMKDLFAAICLHKERVNLQFPRGTELPDPAGLLEGTGKQMRHVKIRDQQTAHSEEVGKLIQAAVALGQAQK